MDTFIRLDHICKSFNSIKALNDVSFDINKGERLTLVGENGSGKSTLIKIIAGVYGFDGGTVYIDEKPYAKLDPKLSMNLGIQVIYQDFSLFPNLTVAENLAFNTNIANANKLMSWKNCFLIAKHALDLIKVDIPLNSLAGKLSTADRQLIAIAKALLCKAKLIIMDEPTTSLTNREIQTLLSLVDQLKSQGIGVIFVSHKLEEVLTVSDRVVTLRNGTLISDKVREQITRSSIVEDMSGIKLKEDKAQHQEFKGEPVLEVKNLFGKNIKDICFKLYKGEILGLAGLLGSGRKELAETIMGISPSVSGKILKQGKLLKIHKVQDAIRHHIVLVPEDRLLEGLFVSKSMNTNMIAASIDGNVKSFRRVNWLKINQKVLNFIKKFNIKIANLTSPANTMSGGNQQKVVIAKYLLCNPDILMMIGPTVGVDIKAKLEIIKQIKELSKQGMSIIIISDDLPELLQISNNIAVMTQGRLSAKYDIDSMSEEKIVKLLAQGEF